ncbi:hypothetical protein CHARACLAT_022698 [Characodon lateralis]|uniref:Uncharacterized protein n=1 Tax=Characodon lateralis TaxID=208331 RepID=A0ABU7D3C8_9TELE|nr:hypothetical protein [Characodon lateralis]
MPIFELQEEDRVPGENPHMHANPMQKYPRLGFKCRTLLVQNNSINNFVTVHTKWPSGLNRRFVFRRGHKCPGSYPTDCHSGSLSQTLSLRMLPGCHTMAAHCSL